MLESLGTVASEYWDLHGIRFLQAAVTIVAVLVGAKIVRSVGKRITERILKPREGSKDYAMQVRRAQTLGPLLLEVERYVIYFVAAVTILAQVGIDTGAILASVGVVGLALGFGAQNLVKDVISGFFLLFDGLVAVGDVVKVNNDTAGAVEAVGLRTTQLRDFSGLLWMVPNGDLRQFGNFNRGWTRAIVPIDIAYEADIRRARETMLEVAERWVAENQEKVLEAPEIQGLMTLAESSVGLRLVIKVKAMEHWGAERLLRERIKAAFDERGIEIPYPRRVLIEKKEGVAEKAA
ncbi:mechanosensitive ion channel family protein [Vulgatibacter sp.]|uniref:mechanosensitive ion channel family protein n=1 Tax=Vulgatibacter sp. TaxID=1971226 RepID=UPI0035639C8C